MEKVKICDVGDFFKELFKNTASALIYKPDDHEMFLEVEGQETVQITCSKCGGEKLVQEGAFTRCVSCDEVGLIGFK